MYVEEDYQFLSHFKKCIPTSTSMPKKFQCLKKNIFFAIKATVNIWTNATNFSHLLKNVSRQKFHAKQFQCLKLNTFFSIKGRKCL